MSHAHWLSELRRGLSALSEEERMFLAAISKERSGSGVLNFKKRNCIIISYHANHTYRFRLFVYLSFVVFLVLFAMADKSEVSLELSRE